MLLFCGILVTPCGSYSILMVQKVCKWLFYQDMFMIKLLCITCIFYIFSGLSFSHCKCKDPCLYYQSLKLVLINAMLFCCVNWNSYSSFNFLDQL